MSNMTAAKRASKKANHRRRHPHPVHVRLVNPEHASPLPVNCPVCRPKKKTWDRDLAGKAV